MPKQNPHVNKNIPTGAPKSSVKTLGRVLGFVFENYKLQYTLVILCILVTAGATLVGNLFLQSLIDDYVMPMVAEGSTDFGPLAVALLKMAGIYVCGVLCAFFQKRILVTVSNGSLKKLRDDLFINMEKLPIKYFDQNKHGEIMSVYTNDIDTLRQFISSSLPDSFDSIITVVITFVSMCIMSWQLTIISVAMVFVTIFVTKQIASTSGKYFKKQQANVASLNGYVEEMIEGQKVVKVFCHEDAAILGFEKVNEDLRSAANSANGMGNIIMPINNNISHMSYVLIAVVGSLLAISGSGGLTLGVIVSFLSLNKNFSRPISQISSQINTIVLAGAGAERVFNLIDLKPEVDEGTVILESANITNDVTTLNSAEKPHGIATDETTEKPHGTATDETTEKPHGTATDETTEKTHGTATVDVAKKPHGEIVISHVDFGYEPGHTILHDISLTARPGEKVAFVGTTGAGKTTITNLINRFYDIDKGTITVDGINIKDIKKASLRGSLGMVLQETNLFTGTVMDNIRYGRLDATDEECIAAAKLANAHSFIKRLPKGYDTVLRGGGAMLSQGERQLLSIARAAVANPTILILDEATSSIDTRTEALIQKGMDRLMNGRTTLVIAHRLSTVKDANKIIVLEGGRIIESGSHDELLAQHGKYYTLYTGNFEEE